MSSIEQKREQFNAFYLIAHPINANVINIKSSQAQQSMTEFAVHMPYAFKIAGEMADIQSQALKPLRGLGDKLVDLVDYLQFQAKKIDLMMSYILQQQDEAEHRYNAIKFGGGGVIIEHHNAVEIGTCCAIKLFVESESAAIYCYAESIECVANKDKYWVSYIYTHIREQDQELLVRASLHLQTATLRAQHQLKQADIDE